MPKVIKYLHQAGTGPVVEFSDAPLKVDGIRYYPAWPWSPWYRQCFRENMARGRMGAVRLSAIPRAYLIWIQRKYNFASLKESRAYIRERHKQTIY